MGFGIDVKQSIEKRQLALEIQNLKLENQRINRLLEESVGAQSKIKILEEALVAKHDEVLKCRMTFEERLKKHLEEAVIKIKELRRKYKEVKSDRQELAEGLASAETRITKQALRISEFEKNQVILQTNCSHFKLKLEEVLKREKLLKRELKKKDIRLSNGEDGTDSATLTNKLQEQETYFKTALTEQKKINESLLKATNSRDKEWISMVDSLEELVISERDKAQDLLNKERDRSRALEKELKLIQISSLKNNQCVIETDPVKSHQENNSSVKEMKDSEKLLTRKEILSFTTSGTISQVDEMKSSDINDLLNRSSQDKDETSNSLINDLVTNPIDAVQSEPHSPQVEAQSEIEPLPALTPIAMEDDEIKEESGATMQLNQHCIISETLTKIQSKEEVSEEEDEEEEEEEEEEDESEDSVDTKELQRELTRLKNESCAARERLSKHPWNDQIAIKEKSME